MTRAGFELQTFGVMETILPWFITFHYTQVLNAETKNKSNKDHLSRIWIADPWSNKQWCRPICHAAPPLSCIVFIVMAITVASNIIAAVGRVNAVGESSTVWILMKIPFANLLDPTGFCLRGLCLWPQEYSCLKQTGINWKFCFLWIPQTKLITTFSFNFDFLYSPFIFSPSILQPFIKIYFFLSHINGLSTFENRRTTSGFDKSHFPENTKHKKGSLPILEYKLIEIC